MYLEDSPYQRDQLINIDQVIGRSLDRGVELGENHRATIEKYVSLNLIPRLLNGDFPATVVDRLVSIDKLVKEGKSLEQIQKIISEERRKFLKQPLDLPTLVDTYKKASKSLLMLSVLAFVIYLGAAGLSSSSNPIATEIVGKPVGNVLAAFIRQAKDADANSTDPLGITNISEVIKVNEKKELIIEKQIIQIGESEKTAINLDADKVDGADAGTGAGEVLLLDQFGDINIIGSVTISGIFTGDGSGLTNLPIPGNLLSSAETYDNPGWLNGLSWSKITGKSSLLTSIDGVVNDLGNIDLIAGSGITITPDDSSNTITLSVTGGAGNADLLDSLDSGQFLRSDASDNYTAGTLTFDAATTLSVLGNLSLNNTATNGFSLTHSSSSNTTKGLSIDSVNTSINDLVTLYNYGIDVLSRENAVIPGTKYIYGIRSEAQRNSAVGPAIYLIGLQTKVSTTAGAGSAVQSYGLNVASPTWAGGVPTLAYGINIANQGTAGTTSNYSLYIAGATGATNNYSLYLADTAGTPSTGITFGAIPIFIAALLMC